MPNAGILRIKIDGAIRRATEAQKRWPAANRLYRQIFADLGMPLLPGYEEVTCSIDDFKAGYDYILGIDVILTLENEGKLTLQEKFLFTRYRTVTVEYMQNPVAGERGDWFNMKTQLYFVGYDRNGTLDFQEWILLNWPAVKMANINWRVRANRFEGAQANFRYARFDDFPNNCIIARSANQ